MKRAVWWIGGGLCVIVVALMSMIIFGASAAPAPMRSVVDMATAVATRDMPEALRLTARDGTSLAYRAYPASGREIAILFHGSSGSSRNMHAVAEALQRHGMSAYALDIRGHGGSGPLGDIGYVGQLEDDLEDFVAQLRRTHPNAPIVLLGHSSGGGFVIRIAGSSINHLFSRYVLLAPYLRYDAPTSRSGDGAGWVKPFVPRIIALSILHRLGIDWFSGLPVLAFAVPPDAPVTKTYSFRLWTNFGPGSDYLGGLGRANAPVAILVGQDDEIFRAEKFAVAIEPVATRVTVELIPGVNHMGVVSDARALTKVVATVAVDSIHAQPGDRKR